jgi:syntaxin-binding protein 1
MGRGRHTFRNEREITETKEAILNDEDKVWVEVRHMHMKDALDKLIEAFKQYEGSESGGSGCALLACQGPRDEGSDPPLRAVFSKERH